MLKKRIIPVQLLMGGRLVKTQNFKAPRDVGDPISSAQVYNSQNADELVFLNIERINRTITPLVDCLERLSEVCFMPLTVGGGVKTVDDAGKLIKAGADKIILSSICYESPDLISRIADRFGSQAVVVGIDVRRDRDTFRLMSDCGNTLEDIDIEEHVSICISAGAGEILIQSIDRDGAMNGFDIELLEKINILATVPVIALGGAGNYDHLKSAFSESNVSAVACGSLFNFSDSNPIRAKAYLSNYGLQFKVV